MPGLLGGSVTLALPGLTTYLLDRDDSPVVLSFVQIEAITGRPLPGSARRHPAFWSNSVQNPYSRVWREAGFAVTRRGLPAEQVAFVRVGSPSDMAEPRPPTLAAASTVPDALLVGCVATKRDRPMPAKDLYASDLFARRRRYAERSRRPWFILSALYGLVEPDRVIEPYDLALASLSPDQQNAWGERVAVHLEAVMGSLQGRVLEIHAGEEYVVALRTPLRRRGADLSRPLQGLTLGRQLQWYDQRAGSGLAARMTPVPWSPSNQPVSPTSARGQPPAGPPPRPRNSRRSTRRGGRPP